MLLLGIVCGLSGGCGLFSAKPALPKQVSSAASADELISSVRRADIIYFPTEAVGSTSAEHPVWKILAAFKRSERSFAIAWKGIGADQQSILDEIAEKPDQLESALGRLKWNDGRHIREDSTSILRATPGIRHLAIGAPRLIEAKIQSGARLSSEEKAMVPRDYRAPENGLENFAEQLASRRRLSGAQLTNLYQAHLFTEQFAADRIVAFLREHPRAKLLVFLRRHEPGRSADLAYFVEQKLKVRQLKLDRSPPDQAHLITSSRTGDCSVVCL